MKHKILSIHHRIQATVLVLAIVACLGSAVLTSMGYDHDLFGTAYFLSLFIVGGCQVLGALYIVLHVDHPPKFYPRYLTGLFALTVLGTICMVVPPLTELIMAFLVAALFLSPIVAILFVAIPARASQDTPATEVPYRS